MRDREYLNQYNFIELGKIYIEAYKDVIINQNRGYGLGFGELKKESEELKKREERLKKVVREFRDRDFDNERLEVYRSFLTGVVNFEEEGDYENATQFGKMCEHFYRTVLD